MAEAAVAAKARQAAAAADAAAVEAAVAAAVEAVVVVIVVVVATTYATASAMKPRVRPAPPARLALRGRKALSDRKVLRVWLGRRGHKARKASRGP